MEDENKKYDTEKDDKKDIERVGKIAKKLEGEISATITEREAKEKREKQLSGIREMLDIHHNIRIHHFDRVPDDVDWENISGFLLEEFAADWEREHKSATDNNPYNKEKGDKVYTHGRMGATLYWEKYWYTYGAGDGTLYPLFYYEEDKNDEGQRMGASGRGDLFVGNLYNMSNEDVDEVYNDLKEWDDAIDGLMKSFYQECEYRGKEIEKNKKEDKR